MRPLHCSSSCSSRVPFRSQNQPMPSSKILDTFKSWLNEEPDINDLEGLRELAAKENRGAVPAVRALHLACAPGRRPASRTRRSHRAPRRRRGCARPPGRSSRSGQPARGNADRGGPLLRTVPRRANGSSSRSRKARRSAGRPPSTLLAEILLFSPDRRTPTGSAGSC